MSVISPIFILKFFSFCKFLLSDLFFLNSFFFRLLFICSLLSIIIGTCGAYIQTRFFRFLAYTSLSHLGYMLLLISTANLLSLVSALFYLLIYWWMLQILFIFVNYLTLYTGAFIQFIKDWGYLRYVNIYYLFFLGLLFSFAGIPPFLGFFPKLSILVVLINKEWYLTCFLVLLTFVINAYLYIRIISFLFFNNIVTISIQNQSNLSKSNYLMHFFRNLIGYRSFFFWCGIIITTCFFISSFFLDNILFYLWELSISFWLFF